MSKQSISISVAGVASANPIAEIIAAGATTVRVTEIDIATNDATGGRVGIGFPAAIGVTPTTPTAFQLHDANDQGTTATLATAWGTPPTIPANFLFRLTLPASAGSVISIVIPEGIVIPAGKTLCLWSITTTGVIDLTPIISTKQLAQTLANY
jgi:hypothetical protein